MIEALLNVVDPTIEESGKPPIADELNGMLRDELPVMIYFENYGILDSAIFLPRFVDELTRDSENPRVRTINAMFQLVGLGSQGNCESWRQKR